MPIVARENDFLKILNVKKQLKSGVGAIEKSANFQGELVLRFYGDRSKVVRRL